MIEITDQYRNSVLSALERARGNYDGSDAAFAKKYGINKSVYSTLKSGDIAGKLSSARWLELGRLLGVRPDERKWNMARTDVYNIIEERVLFCKEYSKSRMFVDECAIGKTYAAKYLARTVKNCFYIDATQCRSKGAFIRTLARVVGADTVGTMEEVEDAVKYVLMVLPKPVVIIDEAGALSHTSLEVLHGLWNGTENSCGWFLLGADGLRTKLQNGKNRSKKTSYKELFSRFSSRYESIVPSGREDRLAFFRKLISDVLYANVDDSDLVAKVTNRCLQTDSSEAETGLRRAESLLILSMEH